MHSPSTCQVPGLKNEGNTCFLNAVLQGLAACPSYVTYLERAVEATDQEEAPLAAALLNCLQSLQADWHTSGCHTAASARPFLDAFRNYRTANMLEDGQQNDAAEALELLLDTVSSELQRWFRSHGAIQLAGQGLLSSIADQTRMHMGSAAKALHAWKTLGAPPLEAMLAHEMVCVKCQHRFSWQFAPCLALHLSLPTAQGMRLPNGATLGAQVLTSGQPFISSAH
ncbi:hypothetical protein WJX72_009067 [[Myrmecia] bisecta]|uniref:ubiquitinyl hydrolase 1 n=1 Tax=[Myrmecia] bisecta TaxID=41462 RepID=A0AAW1Q688_9CHLO